MTSPAQRIFHGEINCTSLADRFAARFSERRHHIHIETISGTRPVNGQQLFSNSRVYLLESSVCLNYNNSVY